MRLQHSLKIHHQNLLFTKKTKVKTRQFQGLRLRHKGFSLSSANKVIINVAEHAGFCFGVKRALDKVEKITESTISQVRTLGPLIHNEQVLQRLAKKGIKELQPGENPESKRVVIRAHGVSPQILSDLKDKNIEICNATCPKVGYVQSIVKKFRNKGYWIVIVGDKGHAEVEGLLGFADNKGSVVSSVEEVAQIPMNMPVCVVAQTTQNSFLFKKIVSELSKRVKTLQVFNTICSATLERQTEAINLAHKSDLMIVVGGKKSANTQRLAELTSKICKTLWIQVPDDLDALEIEDLQVVSITAGASTPQWLIQAVYEKVKNLVESIQTD